jgi:hypothetical protein
MPAGLMARPSVTEHRLARVANFRTSRSLFLGTWDEELYN